MPPESSYQDDYPAQAEKLCRLGATDEEVADFFGISVRTLYRWKNQHEALCHALKAGKDEADERVVHSLYHRAIGYTHDEDKIFMHEGAPVTVPTKKHYPPDTTAAIFWLKNRKADEWREKQTTVHEDPDGKPVGTGGVKLLEEMLERFESKPR